MSNIVHIITGLGLGGAESVLVRTVLAAKAAGAPAQSVISLMEEGDYGAPLREQEIEVHCLGLKRGFPRSGALIRLVKLLKAKKPAVIMSWLYHADLAATLAAILSGVAAKRVIWNLRCADMDFSQYPRTTRWTVSALAKISTLPGAVAANSRAGRVHHEKLGYRPKRWVHLPNGFDLDRWRPDAIDRAEVRAELGIRGDQLAVAMVARADPMKDHRSFLDAAVLVAGRHEDVRFLLVGAGTDALPLPPQVAGRILMLGERRDVPRLMRGMDISVLSSISEGFPNVVAEAMASGVPCVVTDVGDAALIAGDTGEVVPRRSPRDLAAAIERLATEGVEARQRRGERARQRIAEHYSLARAQENYRRLWAEIAAG